MSEIFLLIF